LLIILSFEENEVNTKYSTIYSWWTLFRLRANIKKTAPAHFQMTISKRCQIYHKHFVPKEWGNLKESDDKPLHKLRCNVFPPKNWELFDLFCQDLVRCGVGVVVGVSVQMILGHCLVIMVVVFVQPSSTWLAACDAIIKLGRGRIKKNYNQSASPHVIKNILIMCTGTYKNLISKLKTRYHTPS
jgi:hypothetical protein